MPAWLAVTVQLPVVTSVTKLPLTVQTAGVLELKLTASPELELAARVSVLALSNWFAGWEKVID